MREGCSMVQESANKTIPEREEKQAGKAVT